MVGFGSFLLIIRSEGEAYMYGELKRARGRGTERGAERGREGKGEKGEEGWLP